MVERQVFNVKKMGRRGAQKDMVTDSASVTDSVMYAYTASDFQLPWRFTSRDWTPAARAEEQPPARRQWVENSYIYTI